MESAGGLRRYQASILEQVGAEGAHIMMPEGAGGPAVGAQLVRRLEQPAVVFTPTVMAQLCWQDELARELPTLDSRAPAPIILRSYSDLQTAEAASALLSGLAVDAWAAELVATGQARDEAAARARMDRGRAHNARKFNRTLARRRAQLTAALLRGPAPDLERHLPPMTRRLVEALVAHSVRVIVLDACDQLRDGWAVALCYLAHRIAAEHGPPTMIGLSTVPHHVPGAHRHCRRVIGGQDVSPPAPALVGEGAVAPYRELVHFVPTRPERAQAAAEILARERAARPTQLRAVALTEREAGGRDVLRALLADERARELGPMLITEDGLAVESSRAERLLTSCAAILRRLDLHACCRIGESTVPGVHVLVGEGPDWSARTVATLGAWALDSGMTRCLVSAADSPAGQALETSALDTVIDLTSRPTMIAAKLRGRALRLDESTPGKAAHIWHVVASDRDVRRFVQRLEDRWGLALAEPRGRVVRGAAALDYTLASGAFDAVDYRWLTMRCLAEIGDRESCRRQWALGAQVDTTVVASVDAAQVAQPRRIRELLPRLAVPLLLAALLLTPLLLDGGAELRRQLGGRLWLAAQGIGAAIAALTGVSAWRAGRVLKTARGSVESRLLALGHAVLDALRKSGRLSPQLRADLIRLRLAGQRYEITIADASRRDAEVFAIALAEALAPPRGQRYVVNGGARLIPVPRALSHEPERFLRAWRRRGGVGRLADGPPASARPGAVAFEIWGTDLSALPASLGRTPTAAPPKRRSAAQPPISQSRILDESTRTTAHEPLIAVHDHELLNGRARGLGSRARP